MSFFKMEIRRIPTIHLSNIAQTKAFGRGSIWQSAIKVTCKQTDPNLNRTSTVDQASDD